MAGTVFWDVDTQVDFMSPTGKLYVRGAEEITENLAALTRHAESRGLVRVASVDAHGEEDAELSDTPDFADTFPPHCLRGTEGQRKVEATVMRDPVVVPDRVLSTGAVRRLLAGHRGEVLIEKSRFDVFSNPNTEAVLDALDPETLVVYGVAEDVCDAHAVAGFLRRGGARVVFVQDAARAIVPERGTALRRSWEDQGVVLTTTAEVLSGRFDAPTGVGARLGPGGGP
jgi:nicotinamidase/pyrazinamidase